MSNRIGSRDEAGFTLLEMLAALLVSAVVISVVVGTFRSYSRYRLHVAADNHLTSCTLGLQADLEANLSMAGKLRTTNRQIVRDTISGQARPCAFLDASASKLTVVVASEESAGEVFGPTQPSVGRLVIRSVRWNLWQTAVPGSMLIVHNPAGQPALYRLNSTPRNATLGDFSGWEGKINLTRTCVVDVSPVSDCLGVGTLTQQVEGDSRVSIVTRIVKYDFGQSGVVKTETTGCTQTPLVSPMTPRLGHVSQLRYWTASGDSSALPADLRALRGIRVFSTFTEPTTKLTKEVRTYAHVENWR